MTGGAVVASAVVASALIAAVRGWFITNRRLARRQRELQRAQALIHSLRAVEVAATNLLNEPDTSDAEAARRQLADALAPLDSETATGAAGEG